jgi:hypothetical protein
MEKAKMRRDIVLDQMGKYYPETYSQAEIVSAKAKPIKLADTAYYQSLPKSTAWDYPIEEIRKIAIGFVVSIKMRRFVN